MLLRKNHNMFILYLDGIINQSHKILVFAFTCIATFLFAITCCYASANSIVDAKLQKILDDFRVDSNVPAAALSIHFSNNKISNFLSGTTEKITSINPNPP